MDIEALYTVHFAVPGMLGAGVVVLETGRFFGGDAMYYYVGDYHVGGNKITGRARIVLHTPVPGWVTLFGDNAPEFHVQISGTIDPQTQTISGAMVREDLPMPPAVVTLQRRESLP